MRRKSVQKYKISCVPLQRKSEKCMRIDVFNKRQRGFAISTYHFRYICCLEIVYEGVASTFVASMRCLLFVFCCVCLARTCCLPMSLLRKNESEKPMSSVLVLVLSWQRCFANDAVGNRVASCCALRFFCKAWKNFFLRFLYFLPAPAGKTLFGGAERKHVCAYASSMKRTSHCPTSFVP